MIGVVWSGLWTPLLYSTEHCVQQNTKNQLWHTGLEQPNMKHKIK